MKSLAPSTKQSVVSLIDGGLSGREIASQLPVSRRTGDRIRKDKRPDVPVMKKCRPRKVTSPQKRRNIRMINAGKAKTASDLVSLHNSEPGDTISPETIRRVFRKAGLRGLR